MSSYRKFITFVLVAILVIITLFCVAHQTSVVIKEMMCVDRCKFMANIPGFEESPCTTSWTTRLITWILKGNKDREEKLTAEKDTKLDGPSTVVNENEVMLTHQDYLTSNMERSKRAEELNALLQKYEIAAERICNYRNSYLSNINDVEYKTITKSIWDTWMEKIRFAVVKDDDEENTNTHININNGNDCNNILNEQMQVEDKIVSTSVAPL